MSENENEKKLSEELEEEDLEQVSGGIVVRYRGPCGFTFAINTESGCYVSADGNCTCPDAYCPYR